jgi:hypothetical protein
MIDNAKQVGRLIDRLATSLPIPAAPTPECVAMFRKETGADGVSPQCRVTQIHYAGDGGGIVCGLELDHAIEGRALYASITHLRFDPRSGLGREIIAYQKHRTKRLQRVNGMPQA